MSENLKISVSGIRGIIGKKDGLTPELVVRFGSAFGSFCEKGKILVGMDTRPTGVMVKHALFSGLISAGCDVVDAGVLPTPVVIFLVKNLKMSGGVIITASHNPIEWNALKLVHSDGRFLTQNEGKRVLDIFENKKNTSVKWNGLGKINTVNNEKLFESYMNKIFKEIDLDLICKKKFKVAIDPVNGAGSRFSSLFLKRLGCNTFSINDKPTGIFGRSPEPVQENLKMLGNFVKKVKADIGFALDPDADRLAIVDENGNPLGEEYTLALCVNHILSKRKSDVVINQATSLATEKIAQKFGCKVFRTKIGEINVLMGMISHKSIIGGEGNGGVIYPKINTGRDSFVAMALILQTMAENNKKISELKKELPQYQIVKTKIEKESVNLSVIQSKLKKLFPDGKFSFLDGIKVILKDSWVLIRPSNTEPITRIIVEARDKKTVTILLNKIKSLFF